VKPINTGGGVEKFLDRPDRTCTPGVNSVTGICDTASTPA